MSLGPIRSIRTNAKQRHNKQQHRQGKDYGRDQAFGTAAETVRKIDTERKVWEKSKEAERKELEELRRLNAAL